MRAKEDCCGNERIKVRRKRLKKIAGKYRLTVEGMHCRNCEKRVTEAINEMNFLAYGKNLSFFAKRVDILIRWE